MLKEGEDSGEIPADDRDRGVKKVEDAVAEGIKQVDAILAHKEKDIMEV